MVIVEGKREKMKENIGFWANAPFCVYPCCGPFSMLSVMEGNVT